MHDTKFSGRKFIFFDQICFFFIKSAWLAATVIADKAVLPAERGISAQFVSFFFRQFRMHQTQILIRQLPEEINASHAIGQYMKHFQIDS